MKLQITGVKIAAFSLNIKCRSMITICIYLRLLLLIPSIQVTITKAVYQGRCLECYELRVKYHYQYELYNLIGLISSPCKTRVNNVSHIVMYIGNKPWNLRDNVLSSNVLSFIMIYYNNFSRINTDIFIQAIKYLKRANPYWLMAHLVFTILCTKANNNVFVSIYNSLRRIYLRGKFLNILMVLVTERD